MEEGVLQEVINWLRWVGLAHLYLAGGVLLLAPLGVAWAPFAAAICWLIARLRKLDGGPYAAAGAKSSALLFLPFFHVLARSLGVSLPVVAVRGTYWILYEAWALWIVAEVWGLGDVLIKAAAPGDSFAGVGVVLMAVLFLMIVPLHILLWIVSVRMLLERGKFASGTQGVSNAILPPPAFVESLFWIFGGALMFGFYIIAGVVIVHISTVGR